MDFIYGLCSLVVLLVTVKLAFTTAQQHRPCEGNCDQACYFEFSKYDANAFLSSGKRSTPRECCHETYCEQQKVKCKTEQYRAFIAKKYTCPPGQVVGVTSWCFGHYAHVCTDPCKALQIERCENGGTCIPQGIAWTCSCRPGFEGTICAIDIDECATVTCNTTTSYGCIDMDNDYRCDCKGGWTGRDCLTDIDECWRSPCQNSGTCNDHVDGYSCICSAGFTGTWCEQDINECESGPCQNGGTCKDHVNHFSCECPFRYYGDLCETGICRPSMADVVFVLDSSISQTAEEFSKQLAFIRNFIDHVVIGEENFQIAVITFSFEAEVEIELGQYNDNKTLKEAVQNITYRPGATYTNKGLDLARTLLANTPNSRPFDHLAKRYVFVLTDGMSTRRTLTKEAAKLLQQEATKVLAIGIGPEVSHQELLDIATAGDEYTPEYVFLVNNFNALYSIVTQLVALTCDECNWNTSTDVAILVDTSSTISTEDHQAGLDALTYLTKLIIDRDANNSVRMSLVTFDQTVETHRDFSETSDKENMLPLIQRLTLDHGYCNNQVKINSGMAQCEENKFTEALRSLQDVIFNESSGVLNDSRKLVIMFTNGQFELSTEAKHELKAIINSGIFVYVVGLGMEANMSNLQQIVNDPANIYSVIYGEPPTNLDAVAPEIFFSSCSLSNDF